MKENPLEKLAAESPAEGASEIGGNALPIHDLASNSDVVAANRHSNDVPEPEIVTGEIVYLASDSIDRPLKRLTYLKSATPSVAEELDGIAANGGAIGSLVLGIWCIAGSLLTHWSLINGILGLILGIWGISSKRPRLAWVGIILCLIGCFLSMILISEVISRYLNTTDEKF